MALTRSIGSVAAALTVATVVTLSASLAHAQQTTCPDGQSATLDTAGHCCWPAQAWSSMRQVCVGTPQCPDGFRVDGESCARVCSEGRTITPDTSGHCCWQGQAWSTTRSVCVGLPSCPAGMQPSGESCVPATPAPTPTTAIVSTAGQPAASVSTQPTPAPTDTATPPVATEPACPEGMRVEGDRCAIIVTQSTASPAPVATDTTSLSPTAVASDSAPRQRHLPWAGLLVAGGGVVLLAIGGITWAVSDTNYATLRRQCDTTGCPPDARSRLSGVQTLDTVADFFLVSGALAATAGVIATAVLWNRSGESARRPVATIAPSPNAMSVVLQGRF